MEIERGVLVLKRIHVSYRLEGCPDELRAAAQRAFEAHQSHCPVAVSIGGSITITTSIAFA